MSSSRDVPIGEGNRGIYGKTRDFHIPYDFFSSLSYRYIRANIDVRYNRYGIGLCICALCIVRTQWFYTFPVKNVLLKSCFYFDIYFIINK